MQDDYIKAKKLGEREKRRDAELGRYPYPPALDDILGQEIPSEIPVGTIEIPICLIAGTRTRGRTNAFSAGFYPLLDEKSEFARKWISLYDSQLDSGIREPIKVYEYMNRFYVQEGNKRVSVSKYVGNPAIVANVIRLMPKASDEKAYRVYSEFLEYYKVMPLYDIVFTEEGSYRKLAAFAGKDLQHVWPQETIETVKAAYERFRDLFVRNGGGGLSMTAGDAMLVYLSFYDLDSLENDSENELTSKLDGLWNEILLRNNEQRIDYVRTPEPPKKSSGLLNFIKKQPAYTEEHPLKIAFLYDRTPETSSWCYGHELGRKYIAERFKGIVDTIKLEGCAADAQIREAVDAAAADEDELVFTISSGMMAQTLRAAVRYPEIRFMNCSVNLPTNAVQCYYERMYEAKFLMGALAASVSKNHRIGYIAAYPIYGTIANINAFAIGAGMVDPQAEVRLVWSSQAGKDSALKLEAAGCDIISGPELIRPEETSRVFGIYRRTEDGRIENLALPVIDWGRYYEQIIRAVMDGTIGDTGKKALKAQNYWYGMSEGVIDIILSEKLSYQSRKLIGFLKQGILQGTIRPFAGELRSQTETVRTEEDPDLTDEEIITMNWLCDNVVGKIPDRTEISEEAPGVMEAAGVTKAAGTADMVGMTEKAETAEETDGKTVTDDGEPG